jgi:hypothetical protein
VNSEVRPAGDPARSREAGATAHRLLEADSVVVHPRLGSENVERNARDRQTHGPEAESRRSHQAATRLAVVDDLAVLDLDPRAEAIGLAEAVAGVQPLEIAFLQTVRRWLVVVADAELERNLRHALDRLGRNPRDRCDRRLEPHRFLL